MTSSRADSLCRPASLLSAFSPARLSGASHGPCREETFLHCSDWHSAVSQADNWPAWALFGTWMHVADEHLPGRYLISHAILAEPSFVPRSGRCMPARADPCAGYCVPVLCDATWKWQWQL